jgi:predicted dehydrogenase
VRVEALGVSVLGGHEDMASARLTFANGCVAQLTASRVHFAQQRVMRVFTPRRFVSLDFAARCSTVVSPEETIIDRTFDVNQLTAKARDYWKDHLFAELLVTSQPESREVNAIEEEQRDFVECVRLGKKPVVDGVAGRNAVALAEQILESIAAHQWDGNAAGRKGAFAMPEPPILKSPTAWQPDAERRRAG